MSNPNLSLSPITRPARGPSMSGSTDSQLERFEIDATRARQTERPAAPFRSVLAGGVSLLMSGAEVATHVVGGPVLAAAVHDARAGAANAIAGANANAGATSAPAIGGAGSPGASTVESMMQQGQMSNFELLALQQQVQQENQRFTTVSNVMRAKHDTAKAAVSNIRA